MLFRIDTIYAVRKEFIDDESREYIGDGFEVPFSMMYDRDTLISSLLPDEFLYTPDFDSEWSYQIDVYCYNYGGHIIHIYNNEKTYTDNSRLGVGGDTPFVYGDILAIPFHAKKVGEILDIVYRHYWEYLDSPCVRDEIFS